MGGVILLLQFYSSLSELEHAKSQSHTETLASFLGSPLHSNRTQCQFKT